MSSLRVIDDQDEVLEPLTQTLCEMCQKQFSNYVCPRCNLRYCSLACYKDLLHADCTESFYRDSVTAEIQNRDLDSSSKSKMLDMLQRLEQENIDLLDDDDDEEEQNELMERFSNIDIENTDPDLIWDLLSDKEREAFQGVLKELQHSGHFQKLNLPTYLPWWKQQISLIHDEEEEVDSRPELPETCPNFEKMTQIATRSSPHLAWNLLNILATYSYLMRHAMGDLKEDVVNTLEIAQCLSANVLYSNAAECPYTNVSDVIADIVERIIQSEDKRGLNKKLNNHRRYDLKLLLLQDLRDLIKEATRATYDFHITLDSLPKKKKMTILATRKLYFYVAAAAYLDTNRIDILQAAIGHELSKVELEKQEFQRDFEAAEDAIKQHQQQQKVRIQELS